MPEKHPNFSKLSVSGVPTNIVTGFLGVGKTSAILHLLRNKPEHERWAVLVNEFGEIGIDGSLLESQYTEQQGVYIREVPGGCMCCTAGVPMQVALAQLLRRAKPDRLLIEPTGLGHPNEVLQTLNSKNFQDVLSIQQVVTLVDARQLSDRRYAEHEIFQQQIAIADVVVGNKEDLYCGNDKAALRAYLKEHSLPDVPVFFTQQGAIDYSLLEGSKPAPEGKPYDMVMQVSDQDDAPLDEEIPACGFIKAINKGEGFVSVGWRFSDRFQFDQKTLFAFLSGVDSERLKATLITNKGCFAYNLTRDVMSEVAIDYLEESRIEIIACELNSSWETELFNSILSGPEFNSDAVLGL